MTYVDFIKLAVKNWDLWTGKGTLLEEESYMEFLRLLGSGEIEIAIIDHR